MTISKTSAAVITAYNKGYRIINGDIFYKERNVIKNIKNSGYCGFCIRDCDGKRHSVMIHRLVAFQKYGNKMFEKNIQVRHLDGNCLNNLDSNILIGTPRENNMDKPPCVRMNSALIATSFTRKHDHTTVIKLHDMGLSYTKIMKELNIKSKGTVSFIVKKSILGKEKTKIR